ncbi:MAG: RNA polymerase sigma factor, partial [Limisphaerales bacterium]
MAPPDDELKCIRNSLAGDTEAYAALVKKYQKMVHALAFRMTGSLDDAEDLTQETFLRAYRQQTEREHRFLELLGQVPPEFTRHANMVDQNERNSG